MKEEEKINLIIEDKLVLKLYVSGMSRKSMEAIENIERLCDLYLKGAFELEIIDIYKNPEYAAQQHIVISPSLLKQSPLPQITLIGTFADTKKVLKALDITLDK